MITAIICAVSLQFHGVIGQSAASGEEPLAFTGVRSLCKGPEGRIFFIGDDAGFYEIRKGRPVRVGKATGEFLDWDGRTLRALGHYTGVHEIDPKMCGFRRVAGYQPEVDWSRAAVLPAEPGHPFADKGMFFLWDSKTDGIYALDANGKNRRDLFPAPARNDIRGQRNPGACRIEGLGFLPGTGDLLVATYWPDCKIHRMRPDGGEVVGNGWPVGHGFGFIRRSADGVFHGGTGSLLGLSDHMVGRKGLQAGNESFLDGYARQDDLEFVGTSQGLYVRGTGETAFRRRFGGIRKLSALAVNGKYVFLSMGEKIRWMYLDGDEYEPFASSDELTLRIANGSNWSDRILDLAPDGAGWLKVATGKAGRWRFRHVPPVEYVNHRKLWILESKEPCEKVATPPSDELLDALKAQDVPGGMEIGKIAHQGRWLVVEDVKNRRLLRFRFNDVRGMGK